MMIKGIHINLRDVELIKYLHALKVATYEQIQRDIYTNHKIGSVRNRISRLKNAGLVDVNSTPAVYGKRIVYITPLGFRMFISTEGNVRQELKSKSINHDLTLCDIRNSLLQSSSVVEYLTENQLQTWQHPKCKLHSDALLRYRANDHIHDIPIEYECSMKIVDRYERIVGKYYSDESTIFVFYISDSVAIIDKVNAIQEKLYPTHPAKIFSCTLRDILSEGTFKFESYQGESLVL